MTEDDPFAITLVPIADLEPHPRNAQQADIGAVATSIATHGFHGSVIAQAPDRTRDHLRIIIGHGRWRALQSLMREGFTEPSGQHYDYDQLSELVPLPPMGFIPVQVQAMDDTRALKKLVADNRASALASTDDAALVDLLRELAESEELFGSLFDGDDIDDLVAQLNAAPETFPPHGPNEGKPVTCPSCGTEFIPERGEPG